jgi:hypothetical protein
VEDSGKSLPYQDKKHKALFAGIVEINATIYDLKEVGVMIPMILPFNS